jgi:predicted metal-dependent hydrolase
MLDMKVRYPQIDFEDVFPHWAPHLEFAMINNANSVMPVYLEPYMIKAFIQAKARLDPLKDAELIKEVDWFIAQESQHYRQHTRFNKCFQNGRYPKIAEFEKAFKDDLDGYIANKPLYFNLAYAEGFESTGAVFYKHWFESFANYREGAREEALRLWDWHNAEEFEHREVALKLFQALYANNGIWSKIRYGYFYRIYGVWTAWFHMQSHIKKVYDHFMDMERAEMTPAERDKSIASEKKMKRHIGGLMMRGLLGIFSPFYNPARKPPPSGLDRVLKEFEPNGKYGKPVLG